MRAFVAGATGYTGKAVVRELLRRGIETVAHIRPESPRRATLAAEFEKLGASVEEVPWVANAMEEAMREARPDVVFALLGTTRKRAKAEGLHGNIYEQVEGRLTELLLDATMRGAKDARFVFLSSIGTDDRTTNAYLKVRAETERRIAASGIRYSILRPSFITGSDRDEFRLGERTLATLSDALLSFAGALGAKRTRDRYHSLTASELATALVGIALDPSCENRILENDARGAQVRAKQAPVD